MSGDGAAAAALHALRDAANDAVHTAFTEGTSKRKRAAKETTAGWCKLKGHSPCIAATAPLTFTSALSSSRSLSLPAFALSRRRSGGRNLSC